ncbi:MAG TPA: hypothetical protein IAA77_08270 [Candidatus Avibacteroides excrementipullorum]|nr:hypothetical protein [Candidatus Avibacteroides excrementipullorum]
MKSGLAEEVDALHRRIASAHWGDFFVMVVVGEDSSCVPDSLWRFVEEKYQLVCKGAKARKYSFRADGCCAVVMFYCKTDGRGYFMSNYALVRK